MRYRVPMRGNAPQSTPTHGKAVGAGRRLYNSVQARELLGGISERKFRQLTADKLLRVKKDPYSGRIYVEQSAIDEYIDAMDDNVDPDEEPAEQAA
jgi:hypothetical protein